MPWVWTIVGSCTVLLRRAIAPQWAVEKPAHARPPGALTPRIFPLRSTPARARCADRTCFINRDAHLKKFLALIAAGFVGNVCASVTEPSRSVLLEGC